MFTRLTDKTVGRITPGAVLPQVTLLYLSRKVYFSRVTKYIFWEVLLHNVCTFSKCNEVLKFAKLLKRSANDLRVRSTCDTVCRQHRFIYKSQREQQIEITDKQRQAC